MNSIQQLSNFYNRAKNDDRLGTTHISLYMALFQLWNLNCFMDPVVITRTRIMRLSKISSFATFHKCIKDLQSYGYIRYEPSYDPYRGSRVSLS
jgi:hypothetical protein